MDCSCTVLFSSGFDYLFNHFHVQLVTDVLCKLGLGCKVEGGHFFLRIHRVYPILKGESAPHHTLVQ